MDGEKLVQNIRAVAIQKGIQMKDLYVMAGITSGALSQWKSGKTKPHTSTLSRIADVLKVTMQELLDGTEKAPPAGEGEGRYGLTPTDWKQIGHQFNTKVYSIGKFPGYLACETTGLTDDEVDEFLAGKRYVTKAQIHAMADRLGMKLEDVIMGYAGAFDGEEDEVIAAREWLRRAADQLSPELVIQAARYLDIPEEAQQSAAHDLELVNQVRRNGK